MNSTNQYLDTKLAKNENEIKHTLEKISNLGFSEDPEILNWVDAIIPNWKITFTETYAPEYEILEKGWHNFCAQKGVLPNYIIIVSFIPEHNQMHKHQILWTLYNELIRDGNIVRKYSEITVCEDCQRAILTKSMVDRIHSHSQTTTMYVPKEWNPKCVDCLGIKI
jgi:hypothetical protein